MSSRASQLHIELPCFDSFPLRSSLNTVLHSTSLSENESESRSVVSHSMDYTVPGILQARILEWVVFPFSKGPSQPRDQTQVLPHCRRILHQMSLQGSPQRALVSYLCYTWQCIYVHSNLPIYSSPHDRLSLICSSVCTQRPRHRTYYVFNQESNAFILEKKV